MRNSEFLCTMCDSDKSQFIAEMATDCVSCPDAKGKKTMPCLAKHGVIWCDANSVHAWLISENNQSHEDDVISYEVYGIVDTREIFCGVTDMDTIAYAIANNNLGTARYPKTVIYKVIKRNNREVERVVSERFAIPGEED